MKKAIEIIAVISALALTVSCAKDGEEDSPITYKRVMTSWVKVNYPTKLSDTTATGTYILENEAGYGEQPGDTDFVFVHYSKQSLDGNIIDYNTEAIARQMMAYDEADYYGPAVWQLGKGHVPAGIEEVLKKMKVGGSVRIALPLSASSVDSVKYSTFQVKTDDDNYLYTLTLEKVVSDVTAYQDRLLEAYRDSLYPGLEPLNEGFFFKKLIETEYGEDDKKDTLSEDESIYVRYIARRLNDGKVFDTNIQDTAKKYRLYVSGQTYGALTVKYYQDSATMVQKNSTIAGFTNAVRLMKFGEEAVTFFRSGLGYGDKGQDPTVPEYAPLCFTIWASSDDD